MTQFDNKIKVAIALSGGVDSAVAAKILKDQGHDLVGFFLKLWSDPTCQVTGENRCCNYEALEDARRVAAGLGVPFYVIDARQEFKREVVDYFLEEYKHIRTPNPCIVCNEKIKFDLLLKKAMAIGCDFLATGHYARIENSGHPKAQETIAKQISRSDSQISKKILAKNYKLKAGCDSSKDQSYMLYRLNQEQLSKIIFPLGEMTKKEVRALAVKWDMPVKEKAESQEICFFGDSDYRDFLKRYLSAKYFKAGEIVDVNGNIVGHHDGLVNYTIGQRKGVDQTFLSIIPTSVEGSLYNKEVAAPSTRGMARNDKKKPLYVVSFNLDKNQLIVGSNEETFHKEMMVSEMHWVNPALCHSAESITVKIRSQAIAVGCKIELKNSRTEELKNNETMQQYNNLTIVFSEPQRAVTPGQSAVFYLGDEVIGGGVIR